MSQVELKKLNKWDSLRDSEMMMCEKILNEHEKLIKRIDFW